MVVEVTNKLPVGQKKYVKGCLKCHLVKHVENANTLPRLIGMIDQFFITMVEMGFVKSMITVFGQMGFMHKNVRDIKVNDIKE